MRHTKNVFHPKHGCYVTVQFWDIEGSDMKMAVKSGLRAHAVAVIYDITNRSSFELAQKYLDSVNPRATALLIANKVDLKGTRKVSYEEGRLLAKIHRVEFIETSAKLNYNVDEAFQILVSCVPDKFLVQVQYDQAAARRWKLMATTTSVCALCRKRIRHGSEEDTYPHHGHSESTLHPGRELERLREEKNGPAKFHHSVETLNRSSPQHVHEAVRPSRSFYM